MSHDKERRSDSSKAKKVSFEIYAESDKSNNYSACFADVVGASIGLSSNNSKYNRVNVQDPKRRE